jgi:hypothetical protein
MEFEKGRETVSTSEGFVHKDCLEKKDMENKDDC